MFRLKYLYVNGGNWKEINVKFLNKCDNIYKIGICEAIEKKNGCRGREIFILIIETLKFKFMYQKYRNTNRWFWNRKWNEKRIRSWRKKISKCKFKCIKFLKIKSKLNKIFNKMMVKFGILQKTIQMLWQVKYSVKFTVFNPTRCYWNIYEKYYKC